MANIYPSAGAVGIGTTAPSAPLHVVSGNQELALFQGDPTGSERAYIQITSSNSYYTWQISNQDPDFGNTSNGLAFVESTVPQSPQATRVYFQQGGNVGVGLSNTGSARFAVMDSGGTSIVQLQASGSRAALPTLSLGYSSVYDGVTVGEAGYVQSESPNLSGNLLVPFSATLLNPFGGAVSVGQFQNRYIPADPNPSGSALTASGQATPRFGLTAWYVSGGLNEGGEVAGAHALYSQANYPSTGTSGRIWATMSGGTAGDGSGSIRAARVYTHKSLPSLIPSGGDFQAGIEIGVHNNGLYSGNGLNQNVGLYIESSHSGLLPTGVRNDVGLYVTGETGWHYALLIFSGSTVSGSPPLFWVGQGGTMIAAKSNVTINYSGNVLINGDVAAVGAVGGSPGFYSVSSGADAGYVFASGYTPAPSSRAVKKDISRLSADYAAELLGGLRPSRFRFRDSAREHLGFIAEETPPELAPGGDRISALDVLAVLTRAYKEQRAALRECRREARELGAEINQLLGEPGRKA